MKKLTKVGNAVLVILVVFMLLNNLTFSIVMYDFINSVFWHICLIINGLGSVITLTHLITHFDEDKLFLIL